MPQSHRYNQTYRVIESDWEHFIQPSGRNAWMLDRLMAAGDYGCTTRESHGTCTTQYVYKLRTRYGLNIESITEAHDGPFKGRHARYVLRSKVERMRMPAHD